MSKLVIEVVLGLVCMVGLGDDSACSFSPENGRGKLGIGLSQTGMAS